MRERPILFSGPMVRAILSGQKTQTRRVAKEFSGRVDLDAILRRFPNQNGCPFGQAGDRLWVRESFDFIPAGGPDDPQACEIVYWADGATEPRSAALDYNPMIYRYPKVRPSIHMPRWASRIELEIVDVRVQQLQDISDADAQAEGVEGHYIENGWYWRNYLLSDEDAAIRPMLTSAKDSFRSLWGSINGPGSWDINPYVQVIEFRRIGG